MKHFFSCSEFPRRELLNWMFGELGTFLKFNFFFHSLIEGKSTDIFAYYIIGSPPQSTLRIAFHKFIPYPLPQRQTSPPTRIFTQIHVNNWISSALLASSREKTHPPSRTPPKSSRRRYRPKRRSKKNIKKKTAVADDEDARERDDFYFRRAPWKIDVLLNRLRRIGGQEQA